MENGYNDSITAIFEKMEEFISSKTVIGEPMTMGDITLLPIIEVAVGVAAGGKKEKDSAGGGMGAKIVPSAILVISKNDVRLVSVKNQDAINRLIDMVPGVVSKLDFGGIFNKKSKETMNDNKPKEEVNFEEKIIVD